ncbi:MAG: hypothetical protein ACI4U3_02785 [Traorella sp.]
MNTKILEIENKILNGHLVTKEEVQTAQKACETNEDLFHTYWIMSRYYLDHNQQDALTFCILKCYELNEENHFELEYKVKDFLEARSDFMEEAIMKTRKKLLPLSCLFGVIVLVALWLILGDGEFISFIIGFVAMNVVSIKFQEVGSKKTLESFKKKQYEAVIGFLDENDRLFVNEH